MFEQTMLAHVIPVDMITHETLSFVSVSCVPLSKKKQYFIHYMINNNVALLVGCKDVLLLVPNWATCSLLACFISIWLAQLLASCQSLELSERGAVIGDVAVRPVHAGRRGNGRARSSGEGPPSLVDPTQLPYPSIPAWFPVSPTAWRILHHRQAKVFFLTRWQSSAGFQLREKKRRV